MTGRNLITQAKNTWCPGCGNFSLQFALKSVIGELEQSGTPIDDIVLVTGIGCHAKMADYLNVNSFYSIHGRTIPAAIGIKLANPRLKVLCCAGDGDCYAEGLDHLIFAAKRNVDITVIVHNNRVYGLTTGQYTPTSPLGFRGRSTPGGTTELPINPLELMLASGATFVARGYTRKMEQLRSLVKQGLLHRGFSFIDVLQICATYNNMTDYYNERVYDLKDNELSGFETAFHMAREWDYNNDARIALGLFYQQVMPTYEDRIFAHPPDNTDRQKRIDEILQEKM
jgi:2-oxoglutarate ferredoxin oxidoreductase subunit beta